MSMTKYVYEQPSITDLHIRWIAIRDRLGPELVPEANRIVLELVALARLAAEEVALADERVRREGP
jgi:hypothetical protein